MEASAKTSKEAILLMKKLLTELIAFFRLFKENAKITDHLKRRIVWLSNLRKEALLILDDYNILSVIYYFDDYNTFSFHYDLEKVNNFKQLKDYFNKELAKINQ